MTPALTIKPLLKRGALLAAANWEVVVLQYIAESAFKLMLIVPVAAAAFLVALLVGGSAWDLADTDARHIAALVLTGLSEQPLALAMYLAGVAIIVLGGATFTFLVKGGTVAVLVRADIDAPAVELPPLRVATVRRAAAFDLDRFTEGCGRFFRRYLALGLLLIALYGVIAVVYMFAVVTSYHAVVNRGSFVGWTLVASTISIALVLGVTIVNLLYLLTQIVVAAEDCGVRAAMSRLRRFLSHEHRRVAAIFVVMLAIVGLATLASILATAGLGFIGFIPIVGLTVLPLQMAAWLARGLIFQYLGLGALSTYARLYHGTRATGRREPALAAIRGSS